MLSLAALLLAQVTPSTSPTRHGPEIRAVVQSALDPRTFVLTNSRFDVHVTGHVADVHVEQTFENPYAVPVEAVYVFPLESHAAVRAMRMTIDDRVLVAQIDERGRAVRAYERAKREGRHAALLESLRPNVFRQSVGRIDPGATVTVQIDVVQPVPLVDGHFELVLPTVVGPRYATHPGADVSPPALALAYTSGRTIDITVHVDAGIAVDRIGSPSHAITLSNRNAMAFDIELGAEDRHPNRDFVLRYAPTAVVPQVAQFQHYDGTNGVLSLMLVPPAAVHDVEAPPRDLVFVIDRSCSMHGGPLEAARTFIRHALDDLRKNDRYTVVGFGQKATVLGERALAPTEANLRSTRSYLDALTARGGTEMLEGVKSALSRAPEAGRLRIAVFLTDGYVGNEREVLERIEGYVERSQLRVFAFGIGGAVNRFLLDEMATVGRGATRYVLPGESPTVAARRFADRLRRPVLSDVSVRFEGLVVHDVLPKRVPDLFEGETVTLSARFDGTQSGTVVVRGRFDGAPYKKRIALGLGTEKSFHPGVRAAWADRKIKRLEANVALGAADSTERAAIVLLSKTYGVLSKYTAFVAVEDGEVRPTNMPYRIDVPEDRVVPLTVRQGVPIAMGSLDRSVIRRSIGRYRNDVRALYEHALKKDPKLAGRIDLKFTINGDGTVKDVSTSTTAPSLQRLADKLAALARQWRFPKPQGGGVVIVRYPFVLRP